jgi:hypothetical protein
MKAKYNMNGATPGNLAFNPCTQLGDFFLGDIAAVLV